MTCGRPEGDIDRDAVGEGVAHEPAGFATGQRIDVSNTEFELVGSGGYDGLSAVIFEREAAIGEFTWNAVTFPGDLPPDRE